METAENRPSNTVESFVETLPKASVNSAREIVRSAVAKALTMHPVQGNEMLKRRLGIDLDPDFINGVDDGCTFDRDPYAPDYETDNRN